MSTSSSNPTVHTIEADERGLIIICTNCGQHNRLPYERLKHSGRCSNCKNGLNAPNEPIDILSAASFEALVKRSVLPMLVDFWAEWCGPCKMTAPEVAKVAHSGAGRWLTVKVNIEALPALARHFHVKAIPLFVMFTGGREVARQPGAHTAQALQQFIRTYI